MAVVTDTRLWEGFATEDPKASGRALAAMKTRILSGTEARAELATTESIAEAKEAWKVTGTDTPSEYHIWLALELLRLRSENSVTVPWHRKSDLSNFLDAAERQARDGDPALLRAMVASERDRDLRPVLLQYLPTGSARRVSDRLKKEPQGSSSPMEGASQGSVLPGEAKLKDPEE